MEIYSILCPTFSYSISINQLHSSFLCSVYSIDRFHCILASGIVTEKNHLIYITNSENTESKRLASYCTTMCLRHFSPRIPLKYFPLTIKSSFFCCLDIFHSRNISHLVNRTKQCCVLSAKEKFEIKNTIEMINGI